MALSERQKGTVGAIQLLVRIVMVLIAVGVIGTVIDVWYNWDRKEDIRSPIRQYEMMQEKARAEGRSMINEECQLGEGIVRGVQKTESGITVLMVKVENGGMCGAVAIDDLEIGDRCKLVWIDHFNNSAERSHGDRFALKVKKVAE